MRPPGRLRPEAAVLRQALTRPQDGYTSGLSPKGEYRWEQPGGTPESADRPPPWTTLHRVTPPSYNRKVVQ